MTGNVEKIVSCITLGADVEAVRGQNETTPLLYTIQGLHYEAFKLLLDSGADANKPDRSLRTPLHYSLLTMGSSKSAWRFACDLVLRPGVNINARDNCARTPLMCAAIVNAAGFVELLAVQGADINARNAQGRSAMDFANFMERPAVIQKLRNIESGLNAEGE
ncbi:Ankyrin repeat domain-containing protein 61, partial [Elasticomyces elasticus]